MIEYLPNDKKDWIVNDLVTGYHNNAYKVELVKKVINMLSPEQQSKFVIDDNSLFDEIIAPDESITLWVT